MTAASSDLKPIDLQLLFNVLPGAFLVLDVDFRIQHASDSFVAFAAIQRAALLGQPLPRIFAPDAGAPALLPALLALRQTRQTQTLSKQQYMLRRPDGSQEEKVWTGLLTPVAAADGQLTGILFQLSDVTRQEQEKRAEQRNQELLQAIHQNLNDVAWDLDLQTDVIWWSNGLQTNFGHTPGETEGTATCWYARIHPEDAPRVISGIHQVIDSDLTLWSDVYRFEKKNGEYAEVLTRGSVFRDGAGQAYRMVCTMVDITLYRKPAGELMAGDLVEAL